MSTPPDILNQLKAGNQRFVEGQLDGKYKDHQRRISLAEGQNPDAIILSCSDSRIVPEIIFDTGLGELFTVRVIANVASDEALGSIEYAVAHCNAQCIVVLGHEGCGSIHSAMTKHHDHEGDCLDHLLSHVHPAIARAGKGATLDQVSRKNVSVAAETLAKNSAIIRDALAMKKIEIHTAYYHLKSGKVEFLGA